MHDPPRILLLEADARVASQLAIGFERAGADVITADHALQALQRLAQFTFSGAVIDYWHAADDRKLVAERLLQLRVPFVVHALVEPPATWQAPCVADPDQIVVAAMQKMRPPRRP